MPDNVDRNIQNMILSGSAPILAQQLVERCHITLPDVPKPTGAIAYAGRYYAYVKFFATIETAQRGANRLIDKGNAVLLTRVPKGLVLWVHEPDAERAIRFRTGS